MKRDERKTQLDMMRMSMEALAMPWPGRGAFVSRENF